MSEGTQQATQAEPVAQQQTTTAKVWQDAEVREIIETRNAAKEARRIAEAERDKFKADAEERAKEAQKNKADLEAERKRTESLDAEQKKLRETFIGQITDERMKRIAETEPLSLHALMTMAAGQSTGPAAARPQTTPPGATDFDVLVKAKPGESAHEYAERVAKLKRPK